MENEENKVGSIESPFVEDTIGNMKVSGQKENIIGYIHPELNKSSKIVQVSKVNEGHATITKEAVENSNTIPERSHKVKESWSKKALTTVAITAVIATAMGAALDEAIKSVKENKRVDEAIASRGQAVIDIVNENKGTDVQHQIKYYDTYAIAQDLKAEGLTDDEAIFHVYNGIRRAGVGDDALRNTMNSFVRKTGIAEYFRDYVAEKGFVDKNGDPDFEAYNETMEKLIEAKYNASQIEAKHSF